MKSGLIIALTLLSFTSAFAQSPKPDPATVKIPHEAEYKQIVVEYVRSHRGWFDSNYTVIYNGSEGDNLVFLIDYKLGDTSSNLVTSDFTSFKVVLNPKSKRVEREIFF